MLYSIIRDKRDEWITSPDCKIGDFLNYIKTKGILRDAQIEAIETYLFLKIACKNAPLTELFKNGTFIKNDNVDEMPLPNNIKNIFKTNKAALALYEIACMQNNDGGYVFKDLKKTIEDSADKIDFNKVFDSLFYNISYPDYLFSLPMGAGKTFLMACLIYIDLYFSALEPTNAAFGKNFLLLVPSGLKTSVIPSIKTIESFDPTWVIPNPAAAQIKNKICFEFLEENKTGNKSNKTKNPNVQKVNNHSPLEDQEGLVFVTNAEKVILDAIEYKKSKGYVDIFENEEDTNYKMSNELRNLLGQLPNLVILIDEVHHATDDEAKLRKVVTKWARGGNVNSILSFTGTPYLKAPEKVEINSDVKIASKMISNIVYYYPLSRGIGNFLKTPVVNESTANREQIIRDGLNDFFSKFKDTVYKNGSVAKIAIYSPSIEVLEENTYHLVAEIVSQHGLSPQETILKFHNGNNKYKAPQDAELQFNSLDTSLSKIRVVLLCQIGKEGWDCKSLTGVILSQENDCPTNSVLQTSCRCLREVDDACNETAVIWLNEFNATTLDQQLKAQQGISIKEFQKKSQTEHKINRKSRVAKLGLPKIDYYQIKIVSEKKIETKANPKLFLDTFNANDEMFKATSSEVFVKDFSGNINNNYKTKDFEVNFPITFIEWVQLISKESFNSVSLPLLLQFEEELLKIFNSITEKNKDLYFLSVDFNQAKIRTAIRKCFSDKVSFKSHEEVIPEEVEFLDETTLAETKIVFDLNELFPKKDLSDELNKIDDGTSYITEASLQQLIDTMISMGVDTSPVLEKKEIFILEDKTLHYNPYIFSDSKFEQQVFEEVLKLEPFKNKNIEIYYNGDRFVSKFKVKCYKSENGSIHPIGIYTPDFLLLKRNNEGKIFKILILETKGEAYAKKFVDKKDFMNNDFVPLNNKKYGYERFDFLYIEDTLRKTERVSRITDALNKFFNFKED